ncbi:MAG: DUF1778 domain-containing protein [Phycisphaerae bacterium]|nr:DUF1778 domain-containing protein [Planctomycetota bacterium]MBL7221853.1 DUF1778 domain-containing protein [Phycisphaerae bacterium]
MSTITHNTRLDVRLAGEHKKLIQQAAELLGQSISAFTVSTLVQEAQQVVERFSSLRLSDRDRDLFLDALDNPPEPNERLRRAARAHAKGVSV